MKNENLKQKQVNLNIDKINYKVLNPGGNKTALVDGNEYTDTQKKLINKMIMNKNSDIEQVGFLSNKINRLEMAGGEFCMNATRCAIWEYLKGKEGEVELEVSGVVKKIQGRVLANKKVEVIQEIGKSIEDLFEIKNDFYCIKLDGIYIAILDEEKSKKYIQELKNDEDVAKAKLKQLMTKNLDTKEKAIGIILLEQEAGKTKINPTIWVKEIDTIFYETACGSGSLATAIYNYIKNKDKNIELIQPSGYSIEIDLDGNKGNIKKAIVRGVVEDI